MFDKLTKLFKANGKNSPVKLLSWCLIVCMTTFESYCSSSENFL